MTDTVNDAGHPSHASHPRVSAHKLARLGLFGFLLTFMLARAVVFLIMAKTVPNMYFFVQGNHVHHLNYGILLLSVVGGFAVFRRPAGRAAELAALLYGVAMALTFDEFGMWLHLGGSYWQRASVDAVIIIAAVMGLCAYLRSLERFESHHAAASIVLVLFLAGFVWVLYTAGLKIGSVVGPRLQELEAQSSP